MRAYYTPGHEEDHISYYLPADRAVFSGDTILGNSSSSVRNLKQYMASLEVLARLKAAVLCPGHGQIIHNGSHGLIRPEDVSSLEPWANFWYQWVSKTFLRSYLEETESASFLPKDLQQLEVLLDAYLLEKAIYELNYELNNRPDWLGIPLKGIIQLLEDTA